MTAPTENPRFYDRPWLYKVTNSDIPFDHPHRHVWTLRLPCWIGWLLDRRHLKKWGFIP